MIRSKLRILQMPYFNYQTYKAEFYTIYNI